MISFAQMIAESLDRSYPYHLMYTTPFAEVYGFSDGIQTFSVNIKTSDGKITVGFKNSNGFDKITGNSVSASSVFSTVGNILEDVCRRFPDHTIEFYGDRFEPSRIRLYHRLAEKISQKIGGKVSTRQSLSFVYFKITPHD